MRVKFYDRGDYVLGAIDLPVPDGPGALRVSAVGDDKADALSRAALIAERIASDPVLRAIMPPQAAVAIKAAKGLAAAARRGAPVLKHFWRKLRGPGAKRLAKVLHEEAVTHERQDVGDIGALFRRKRKRKVRPMRRPVAPPRMRVQHEQEETEQAELPADEGVDTEGGEE